MAGGGASSDTPAAGHCRSVRGLAWLSAVAVAVQVGLATSMLRADRPGRKLGESRHGRRCDAVDFPDAGARLAESQRPRGIRRAEVHLGDRPVDAAPREHPEFGRPAPGLTPRVRSQLRHPHEVELRAGDPTFNQRLVLAPVSATPPSTN